MSYTEKIRNIAKKCESEPDFMLLEKTIDSIKNYFGLTVSYGISKNILDIERNDAYKNLHDCLSSLNSFCDLKRNERITDANIENRDEVEKFVGDFVMDMMKSAMKNTQS